MLPKYLQKYFWDVEFKILDKKEDSFFIIERLLEFGDWQSIRWLRRIFSKEEIKEVIKKSRALSVRTCNLWSAVYKIPKNQILCWKKSFPKIPAGAWRH